MKTAESRPRGYKTGVQSPTQNKAQWLAACGQVCPQAANHCALFWVWERRLGQ